MSKKKSMKTFYILLGLCIAVFVMISSVYTVRVTELAVISTFGENEEGTVEPGLHIKMPWQSIYLLPATQQILETKFTENITKDGYNIVLKVYALWKIEDAHKLLNNNITDKSQMNDKLRSLVGSARSSIVSKYQLKDIISTKGNNILNKIELEMKATIEAEAKEEYGVVLNDIGVEKLELPGADAANKIIEGQRSVQLIKAEAILSMAKAEAADIKNKALLEKNKKILEADAEAARIKAEGERTTEELYDVLEQNAELAIFLRELDALEEMMANETVLFIDEDLVPISILKGGYSIDKDKDSNEKKKK